MIHSSLETAHAGLFIQGEWRHGAGETLTVVDPSTEAPIARVSGAAKADVDAAVNAASEGLRVWRATSLEERGARLAAIADAIEANQQSLVALQMRCNGKPRFEAELDVGDAAATFRYYAQCCLDGTVATRSAVDLPDPAFVGYVRHEPVGVCALIVPWNFPMVTTAWKLAPALAAGCSVVVKPSELTPLAEIELVRIVASAGVPAGVVNLVAGGRDIGAALASHRRVAKISFTGSTAAGQGVMRAAADRMQRVSLELGGKSALIVFDDADLDAAVELAANGAFFNAGQMCSATSRVLVAASIYDRFVERLVARAESTTVGSPDEDAAIGPLISAAQRDRVLSMLARGRAEGARALCGETGDGADSAHPSHRIARDGKPQGAEQDPSLIAQSEAAANAAEQTTGSDVVRHASRTDGAAKRKGFFVTPTVYVDVADDNILWRDEIFGPVVSVRAFETESEAIDLANDSDYGLVATVVTADRARGERVAAACEVGLVWINTPQLVFPQAGWGGVKRSGLGRELGPWGVRAFQELKHVIQTA